MEENKNIQNTTQNNIAQSNNDDEIDLREVIKRIRNFFRRVLLYKKQLITFNIIFIVLLVAYTLLFMKNYYTSTIEIFPDSRDKSSGLASLAALAGVSVPGGGGTNIDLFEKIIKSETLIEKLSKFKFYSKEKKDSLTLYEIFKIKKDEKLPKDEAERKRFLQLYEILTGNVIQTEIEKPTKVLTLSVTMNESKLSADVANTIIKLLDDYIRTQRRSYASNTRNYVERRFKEVKDSLTYFENLLVNFRERNRVLMAPELLMNEGRIRRQIEILQSVYLELTKQIEIAKIEEIKDIPVVNVKEYANDPLLKAGPKRSRIILVFEFIFLIMTVAYYGLKDNFKNFMASIE